MSFISAALLAVVLAGQGAGAKEPTIQVSDGRVSLAAENVPLGRLLSLWDKAMGAASQVKPELANKTISVQFDDLGFEEAVRKMFQGQALNYITVGKGIRVYDQVQGGPVTTSLTSSPIYSEPPPPTNNLFVQPQQQPFQQPPQVQQLPSPAGAGQPNSPQAPVNTLFGIRPDPNAAQTQNPQLPPGGVVPGVAPPPLGANPFNTAPAPAAGPTATPMPSPTSQQPLAPGTLGVTPGTLK
jgi:hypothetical protein